MTRRGPDGGGFVGTSGAGDVYAGRDGNVYRNQGGSWQKFDNGSWSNVNAPSNQPSNRGAATDGAARTDPGTIGQLNRDAAARREGTQRTNDASSVRSGSTSTRSGSGSYRPSGGGAARRPSGGGGRRR